MVEIHRLCILSIMDKSMVTPGQAPTFTFPTPKIHFSYNKYCFRKFDSPVAVSQEERGSREFAQTILSLGCCSVHMAGRTGGGGKAVMGVERWPLKPNQLALLPGRNILIGTLGAAA